MSLCNNRLKIWVLNRFSDIEGQSLLAFLGILVGAVSSMVILLFRMLVEESGELFSSVYVYDQFEALTQADRIVFLLTGGLLLWGISHLFKANHLITGVAHVINRVHHYQGRLPFKNAVFQFFGGVAALVGGFSVGREGPAVHLGAWCASAMSQWIKLPDNSTRTLIGCGTAAAISASFNTPLAGAIFAMEVIMMEYTVISAVPVILAAVIGAIATQSVYGNTIAFDVPPLKMGGLWELSLVAVMGFACGTVAAIYNGLTLWFMRFAHLALPLRIIMAIFIMFTFSFVAPQVMGLGYDTVNAVLLGELSLTFLFVLIFAKLLATGACLGLGLPGGLIGPTLFIGVLLGGAFGIIGHNVLDSGTPPAFFAVIGMVAVMGAVLQAPLAALVTLLELTLNPFILLPGMLAVVIAALTCRSFYQYKSLPLEILHKQGLSLDENPLHRALQKVAITNVMRKSFKRLKPNCTIEQIDAALASNPLWVLIGSDDGETDQPKYLMPAAHLARHLESIAQNKMIHSENKNTITLNEIPADRLYLAEISSQSTLHDATDLFNDQGIEALYVSDDSTEANEDNILGVLTRENLRNYYRLD